MRALAVLSLVLLAGCLEPGGSTPPASRGEDEAWILGGAWTQEHTQADIDAWCEVAKRYGNECLVMESFSPQYALRFTSEARCEAARAEVLALQNITARACSRVEPSDDPEQPTSSPPQARWTLHGTFAPGYTAADVDAVCEAGTGATPCAMMKSEPPQYSFGFASREACEEARAKIVAVASARPGECRPA